MLPTPTPCRLDRFVKSFTKSDRKYPSDWAGRSCRQAMDTIIRAESRDRKGAPGSNFPTTTCPEDCYSSDRGEPSKGEAAPIRSRPLPGRRDRDARRVRRGLGRGIRACRRRARSGRRRFGLGSQDPVGGWGRASAGTGGAGLSAARERRRGGCPPLAWRRRDRSRIGRRSPAERRGCRVAPGRRRSTRSVGNSRAGRLSR